MTTDSYRLSVHDERKNAVRLARSAIEKACKDTVVRGQLEALDGVPCGTLSQEIYKVGLLQLVDISTNASHVDPNDDTNKQPNWPVRLKALEILMQMRMKEAELLIAASEKQGAGGLRNTPIRAQVLTQAEVDAMEASLRQPEEP